MGRINGLSDELLVKILSFLPTRVAVSTSILSKQWEFLWMWLPKLEYRVRWYSKSDCNLLRCFLNRNLPLHKAPVIKSFRLVFLDSRHFKPEDIKLWVAIVVSRNVRKLKISYSYSPQESNILPSSLYTCKFLVTLKLEGRILVDVPRMVCLSSLKTLLLKNVEYANDDSLQRLLRNCPILKFLSVDSYGGGNPRKFTVIVPSLLNLTLDINHELDEFVINTPSLMYLKLEHCKQIHSCLIENMPKLREAYVSRSFAHINSLIGSITSVKSLTICLEVVYGDGFVFNQLERLNLCICQEFSSTVLVRLLKDSPNLRVLELCQLYYHDYRGLVSWNRPNTVPGCMLSSLQKFNWWGYIGSPEWRDLAVYILENACRLNTATILSNDSEVPKFEMIKQLALSSRASTTCKLVFV